MVMGKRGIMHIGYNGMTGSLAVVRTGVIGIGMGHVSVLCWVSMLENGEPLFQLSNVVTGEKWLVTTRWMVRWGIR